MGSFGQTSFNEKTRASVLLSDVFHLLSMPQQCISGEDITNRKI
jgi:hypothetical protein